MIFYIDLLYGMCMVMNVLILKTHSVLLSFKLGWRKLLLGAMMGSLISIKSICFSKYIVIDFFMTLFILWFLYGRCKWQEHIRRFLIFLGVTLIYGAIFNMFSAFSVSVFTGEGVFYALIPWWWYIVGIFTAVLIIGMLVFFIKHRRVLYDVEITLPGEVLRTKALLDTGNRLYEPRSGKPVIIIEENMLVGEHKKEDIYIKTAGSSQEHMEIVIVEKLILLDENRIYNNLYAALAKHSLSKNGEFHSLLHSNLKN